MARYDEDWEDELSRPDGYPLTAALIGGAIILGAGIYGQPWYDKQTLGVVLLGGIGAAALVWLVGYAVTIRHATGGWKWGSFLILLGVAILTSFIGLGIANQRVKADVRTLAEIRFGPDNMPIVPEGAEGRGPISRLYIAYIRGLVEDQRKLEAAAVEMRVDMFGNPASLARDPAPMRDCARFAKLRTLSADFRKRQVERHRELIQQLMAADLPSEFKRGAREALERDDTPTRVAEMERAESTVFDESQTLCAILARRRWEVVGSQFGFTREGDLQAFNRHVELRDRAVAEARRLEADAMQRVRDGQVRLRQALRF